MSKSSNILDVARRCYRLAAAHGRAKLFGVMALIFTNGIAQVAGVTSVFPFFALAADIERVERSDFGQRILAHIPELDRPAMLIWAGSASIIMLLFANGISLLSEVVRTHYAHTLGHALRTQLMEALCNRSYGYFLERNSGHLLQKITGDVFQFVNNVCVPLLEAISRFVTILLLLATIFFVQPAVALFSGLLFGGFYVLVFLVLRRRSQVLGEALKAANREMMSGAQQLLGGIKPILVHGKAGFFRDRFAHSSAAQARLLPRVPLYGNTPRYLVEPIVFGSLVGIVLWFAAQGRDLGTILPGLSVLALAAYRLLPSIQILYAQITQIISVGYSAKELEDELDNAERLLLPPAQSQYSARMSPLRFEKVIELRDISFAYPNTHRPVLENITFKIPKNSSVGIVGSTGSGKSTLVDIILGLHSPRRGKFFVDGHEITKADFSVWRELVGYVPQEIFLLDASIEENIAFGVPVEKIDRDAMIKAARAAQILEFIENELPGQWKTEVGERGVRLSGGQRQRIGLARALYHKPQILILDEATSALDNVTEAEVMRSIYSLRGVITMVIIAHRLSSLNGCDIVYQVAPGGCGIRNYKEGLPNSDVL